MAAAVRTGLIPSRMSIVRGGAPPVADVRNLGDALLRAARDDGRGEIRHLRADGTEIGQSYRTLLDAASRVLQGMRRRGVKPQDKVVLRIDDPPQLLAGFWACVLGGFVPVPVGRGLSHDGLAGLRPLWRPSDRVGVLTSAADGEAIPRPREPAIVDLGHVETLAEFAPASSHHPGRWNDLAVLLLTSGSTGVPKAVKLSHRNILSRCVAATATNHLDGRVRSFNWMPLDHVGGLLMFHVRDVYLRCVQVHAPRDWVLDDPLRWLDAMSHYRSTMTWAPNFAFRLVNDRAADTSGRNWDLTELGHIMNGGEPIAPRVIRRFLSLLEPFGLPPTAMFPGWGMSETSAGVVDSRFDPSATDLDPRYTCIGAPHAGVGIRIVDEQDALLPEGTIGLLQASGDPITSGYHHNPEQNRATFTADGWFRTGDLAFIEHGLLTVVGRTNEVIVIDGVDHHSHEIEAAVEELGVAESSYVVAAGVPAPAGDTDVLAVFFHPAGAADVQDAADRIRTAVQERFDARASFVVPVAKDDIPKTEIGKLRRLQLRQRFETQRVDRFARDRRATESAIRGDVWR